MEEKLRPEYDLKELLKEGARDEYAQRYRAGTNMPVLEQLLAEVNGQNLHGEVDTGAVVGNETW